MQEALRALNRLVTDGIIENYAIGGAIGASFYIKAVQTEDIDAFVFLPQSPTGLVTLAPIYEALVSLGGIVEREYVRFGEWPLQILSDSNSLIAEAIRDAISAEYDGIPTRVFRPEHLCAVALQTARSKDFFRVRMFLEQDAVDRNLLSDLLKRFRLEGMLERVQ